MPGREQVKSTQLLQQAKDMGLLSSDCTVTCTNCHAIFPEEYGICPKCKSDIFFHDIQIDFEI